MTWPLSYEDFHEVLMRLFHEEIESQFHMIEFPLEFPQWASCPHPNLSFIPRETLMNTFLSHESFHEEQTEQQMRNLHHKYMYGWNKIKKKKKKPEKRTGKIENIHI